MQSANNSPSRCQKLNRTSRSRKRACAVLAMAVGVMPAIVSAAPFYWTGDNNAFWNATSLPAGTNWSLSADFNNGTPGLPGSADAVLFNLFGAGNLNTVLGQAFSINSLTFTPDDTAAVTIG